jgi:hypothetical protein
MARLPRDPRLSAEEEPPPRFLPVLGYVLGFMVLLGALAFLAAGLLHLLQR